MNKCYFGNFQDFCKYGLLKQLAAFAKAHNIGMRFCQMVTPEDEERNKRSGSANYDYLKNSSANRWFDSELFDDLKEWRDKSPSGGTGDEWLRMSRNLLPTVRHYNAEIPACDVERAKYFRKLRFGQGNVVFFNPDYGLEFAARLSRDGDSRRFIRAEEIHQYIDDGNSALFYQEMLAPEKHAARKNLWRDVIQNLRNAGINNRILFFSSFAPSYKTNEQTAKNEKIAESGYFLVVNECHKTTLEKFAEEFLHTNWCKAGESSLFNITRRIGIFADADNFSTQYIRMALPRIKNEIPMGNICYKVAFGLPEKINEIVSAKDLGFDEAHIVGRYKNAADLGIYFGVAKMICQSEIDIVVVLSGDGGFIETAKQAKAMGVSYIGFGRKGSSSTEYGRMCERFIVM